MLTHAQETRLFAGTTRLGGPSIAIWAWNGTCGSIVAT